MEDAYCDKLFTNNGEEIPGLGDRISIRTSTGVVTEGKKGIISLDIASSNARPNTVTANIGGVTIGLNPSGAITVGLSIFGAEVHTGLSITDGILMGGSLTQGNSVSAFEGGFRPGLGTAAVVAAIATDGAAIPILERLGIEQLILSH